MAKIQPAVELMTFSLVQGVNYIDLAQCASMVNRRSYRQGENWAVAGFQLTSYTPGTHTIDISKLPNTWVLSNSWHKCYSLFQQQRRDALKESPSLGAKWADFKIFIDSAHAA